MTDITFEGEVVTNLDFHVEGKTLWAKVAFKNGRTLDVEVQRSDRKAIVEAGRPGDDVSS